MTTKFIGHKYKKQIHFLAQRMGYIPGIDWQDLVQLAEIKLAEEIAKFDPNAGIKEITWVVTIIKNFFLSERRRLLANANHDGNGTPVYDYSFDSNSEDQSDWLENLRLISNGPSPEEEAIWQDLLTKVKAKLGYFDKLVFACKVEPENVFDGKCNLVERARHELRQKEYAARLGISVPNTKLTISDSTICIHLSRMLSKFPDQQGNYGEVHVSRGQLFHSLKRIKKTVRKILDG